MSTGFEPRRGGGAVATFTGFEADLLRSLASQLVELLRNEMAAPHESADPFEQMMDFTGPTTEPDDPVLARLFPTAYPDDEEAAGEFRRFTEGSAARQQGTGGVADHRHARGGRAARPSSPRTACTSTSSSTRPRRCRG